METPKVAHLKRNGKSTKDFLQDCHNYNLAKDAGEPDLHFLCKDGRVAAHQFMVAGHSEFIRTLMTRFQDVEFSVGDWATGQIFLLDRRKGSEILSVSVPDLERANVQMMIDLFYQGFIRLTGPEEAKVLRDLWKVFGIDSFPLESLDVITEVTLNNALVTPGSGPNISGNPNLLVNIKTEIVEEVDSLIELRKGLDMECNDCQERFGEEEDLLRHMEHIHGTQRSMYDRIKYKRAKTEDKSESHPKNKGKGKGKKSIEPKLLRKDCEKSGNEEFEISLETPRKSPIETNENRNCLPSVLKDNEEIVNNQCGDTVFGSEAEDSVILKSTIEDMESGKNNEKRSVDETSCNSVEPSPKRTRREKKDVTPERLSVGEEKEESENEDDEEDKNWEDIQCLYCDQNVPVFANKPGQNRRKYQQHLLSHFLENQYNEIPEGLRVYQCSYRGCSYAGGSKNPYIQHVAFKHDEWFKRINKRVEEAMKDPEIGDELEELSAVKEIFLTDYRIMPLSKGSSNVKPLWIEGQLLGRDEETVHVEKISEGKKSIEMETPTVEPQESAKKIDSPVKEAVFETILKSQKSLTVNNDTPKRDSNTKEEGNNEENITKAKSKKILSTSIVSKSREEEVDTDAIVTFTGTSLLNDPKIELGCKFCSKIMKIDPSKTVKNRQSYQIHLMESHPEKSMWTDIPDLDKYYCPYRGCEFPGTELKARFRVHLAFRHKEFSIRINRRINELDRTTPSFDKSGEIHTLKDIRDFFQKDPRVVNVGNNDSEAWSKDDILFSAEVIAKAGPPTKSKSSSPTSSGKNTPSTPGMIVQFQTPDDKKQVQSCIPNIQVEISADLIKQLKEEPIKTEPMDDAETPPDKKIVVKELPSIALLTDKGELTNSKKDPDKNKCVEKNTTKETENLNHNLIQNNATNKSDNVEENGAVKEKIERHTEKIKKNQEKLPKDNQIGKLKTKSDDIEEEQDPGKGKNIEEKKAFKTPEVESTKKLESLQKNVLENPKKERKEIKPQNLRKEKPRTPKENVEEKEEKSPHTQKDIHLPTDDSKTESKEIKEKFTQEEKGKGTGKKSKKDIKAQNLRKEKPREEKLSIPTEEKEITSDMKGEETPGKMSIEESQRRILEEIVAENLLKDKDKELNDIQEYDEVNEIQKFIKEPNPVKQSNDVKETDEVSAIKKFIKEPNQEKFDTMSLASEMPLLIDEDKDGDGNILIDDSSDEGEKDKEIDNKGNKENIPLTIDIEGNDLATTEKRQLDSPSESNNPSEKSASSSTKAKEASVNSELYSCKTCKKDFDKRPGVIMHIITQHMQARFGDVPHLIDEKYQCHHKGCEYSSSKRNGLLAHLTLKHNAIKITDVTDLIIHNDEQLMRAVKTEPRNHTASNSSGSEPIDNIDQLAKQIKQEVIETPLPVKISKNDQSYTSWKCRECQKNFVKEDGVRQHILVTHLQDQFDEIAPKGLKIYSCKQCFKYSTVSRTNFIKHLGMLHQVVNEEEVGKFVEQLKSLLLNIDVITCKCNKQFDKQRQLKDHIIFNHYKHKFKHIPKGKDCYKCKESHCTFTTKSRGLLIKHGVSMHQLLSEKEIRRFIPSNIGDNQSEESSSSSSSSSEDEEGVIEDDSSIDFNDSVSQAQQRGQKNKDRNSNEGTRVGPSQSVISQSSMKTSSEIASMPFSNNLSHGCPVCPKVIAQRSNFEDHLEIHGIGTEAALHCVDCDFSTSFAQMYYHLSSYHRRPGSTTVELQCLCCKVTFNCASTNEGIKEIRNHCLPGTKPRNRHQMNAGNYIANAKSTLYFTSRYSCELCSMYFKTTDALVEHGKKFNSRCYQMNQGVRYDPIYTCHLCDFSKAASLFSHHCQGIQHQHNVSAEAASHKEKYGITTRDHFYSCENCLIASSLDNTVQHLKDQSGKCLHMMCGPCGLDVESEDSQGLTNYLQQHVLSDQHTVRVAKFRQNSGTMVPAYVLKYRFCCESCSASFTTYNSLSSHNNCPRSRFCCVPCDFSSVSADFAAHLQNPLHAKTVTTRPSIQNCVGPGSTVSTVNLPPNAEDSTVVDISRSPPQVDISDSPPDKGQAFQKPKSKRSFRAPSLPEGITMSPVRDDVSILEVEQNQPQRSSSPAESIMEVDMARPPSPSPSIMEVDSIVSMSNRNNVPAKEPLTQASSFNRPRVMNSNGPNIRQKRNKPTYNQTQPSSPGPTRKPPQAAQNRSPQTRHPIMNVSNPPTFPGMRPPNSLTASGSRQPPPQSGVSKSGIPSVYSKALYSCSGDRGCGLRFKDPQQFQSHSSWHDSKQKYGQLTCHLCCWNVSGETVSDAVTMHLLSIKHTVNLAKKMSRQVQ